VDLGALDGLRVTAVVKLSSALATAHLRPVGIVGAGSSTMEGYGLTGEAPRWFTRFIRALQRAYPTPSGAESSVQRSNTASFTKRTTPGVHGYNAGHSGKTSWDYLTDAETAAISSLVPAAVLHSVGSNDMANGVAPSTFERNLSNRIQSFQISGYCAHIYVHHHQRAGSFAYPWQAYLEAAENVAARMPGVMEVVDLSAGFRLLGIPGIDGRKYLQADKTHLNEAGHAVLADWVVRALAA
jgi:lysophospholipase L1-like esterase